VGTTRPIERARRDRRNQTRPTKRDWLKTTSSTKRSYSAVPLALPIPLLDIFSNSQHTDDPELFNSLRTGVGWGAGLKYYFAWSWFVILSVWVIVVCMNAMISLLGDTFASIKENEDATKRMERLELIVEYFELLNAVLPRQVALLEKRMFENLVEVDTLREFAKEVLVQRRELDNFDDDDGTAQEKTIRNVMSEMIEDVKGVVRSLGGEDEKDAEKEQLRLLVGEKGSVAQRSASSEQSYKAARRLSVR